MATELKKAHIKLPASAFFSGKSVEFTVKVGSDCQPLHNFFLGTRALFTDQKPITGPTVYHFSPVPCSNPLFKQTPIITVKIVKGKVDQITERKPFE